MEPLSPDDPVFKLLGKSRPVEPRPNFTQNVMRAIRQEPQELDTVWARLVNWAGHLVCARSTWATTAIVATLTVVMVVKSSKDAGNLSLPVHVAESKMDSEGPMRVVAAVPVELEENTSVATTLASEFQNMDQLSLLLAQQDTSALTDSEIALLLY